MLTAYGTLLKSIRRGWDQVYGNKLLNYSNVK